MARIWLVGGSNQVSACLVPLLLESRFEVVVDSRGPRPPWIAPDAGLTWKVGRAHRSVTPEIADALVFIGPLDQFAHWTSRGSAISRAIVFSSTSRFTKADSSNPSERRLAGQLEAGETQVCQALQGGALTLVRPTLIYGAGLDRNLTRLAGWLAKTRCMPMPGPGAGLRQPVHAADLAQAVRALIESGMTGSYELSGGSTLSFREMVRQVFRSLKIRPRFVPVPGSLVSGGLWLLRRWPRWSDLNHAMLQRLEQDLVFPHAAATRDFGYDPRPFEPDAETWLRLNQRAGWRENT